MTAPVLIVDDEPANLATLRQILGADYPLVFARNAAETFAAVAKHQPALILLDIVMPDMSGIDVCARLKADPATENIPVIFVTALAEVGDEAAGFAVGAVDYIIKPVSAPIVRARVRTHLSLVRSQQLEESYFDAVHMMGDASRFKDTETGEHIWRIADGSRALAQALGWDESLCNQMALAAPMHDLGKLGIPDAILHKPGKLDPAEWQIMQTHSMIGFKILATSKAPLLRMAADIARHHHERWDGTGYPDRLAGQDIPMSARIVALTDVFDALTSERPYKAAWPLDKVLDHLQSEAGSHFDPALLPVFMQVLPQILEIRDRHRD